MLCHFCGASVAGFVATLFASPVDVIKTRYMNSSRGTYSSVLHCAMQTGRQEDKLGEMLIIKAADIFTRRLGEQVRPVSFIIMATRTSEDVCTNLLIIVAEMIFGVFGCVTMERVALFNIIPYNICTADSAGPKSNYAFVNIKWQTRTKLGATLIDWVTLSV